TFSHDVGKATLRQQKTTFVLALNGEALVVALAVVRVFTLICLLNAAERSFGEGNGERPLPLERTGSLVPPGLSKCRIVNYSSHGEMEFAKPQINVVLGGQPRHQIDLRFAFSVEAFTH
ncbi:hypothetical protein, partial [Paraburkholderia sp. MM5384-R2]|uniref:hypothetical protein n=1 Tax=Paraburkholderia sp. MM5384-R2 TaxID=2723097 RepID=UPI001C84EAA8